jgi:hypothetical protein
MKGMDREAEITELIASLRERGFTDEDFARIGERALSEREHLVEAPTDEISLAELATKLDKLQETMDRLAAKLDAKDLT